MKPTIMIAYKPFGDFQIEESVLQSLGGTILYFPDTTSPEAREAMRTVDAVMVTIQSVTAEMLADMQRCRIVSRLGTGLDAIDLDAATANGIHVTYVPDYSIDEVSNHAIGLLLAHARGLVPLIQSTRSGQWSNESIVPRPRLKGQILGLLGFGRIGQATATKAQGLGLEVIVYDPYIPTQLATEWGVRLVDLDELLATSDYISLHSPLTEDNRSIINAQALARMKPTAYLINTARGPLIDEEALLHAVRTDQIAGAALDVLSVEPPAPDNPLLHEERIAITPHTAWYSEAAKVDVRMRGAEEVVRVLQGGAPRNPVNRIPL
jgi:D-3-phosphoglycerate dehydrogenase